MRGSSCLIMNVNLTSTIFIYCSKISYKLTHFARIIKYILDRDVVYCILMGRGIRPVEVYLHHMAERLFYRFTILPQQHSSSNSNISHNKTV